MKQILFTLWLILIAGTALAQDNYRIKPGDTLRIEVLEDPQLNRDVLVLPDGRISFPLAGTLSVRGKSIGDVQKSISDGIASNFAIAPSVFVAVTPGEPRVSGAAPSADTIDIYFLGEVNTPGLRPVEPGTTFLQALSQSGGMTRFAAQKRLQLRRTDKRTGAQSVFTINYRDLTKGAEMTNNIVLQEGDVILVPERRLFE